MKNCWVVVLNTKLVTANWVAVVVEIISVNTSFLVTVVDDVEIGV